ncbi:MAG: 4Fe-4S binding protein [Flavobacteriaceae bacterium]|nr:4Fe-4S binding protein [Flavobacteriaceae bacterium]
MRINTRHITTAFETVAKIAFKTNEVLPIYPCTPTSEMSALAEEWSATKQQNIYGKIPTTFQMQSEAGVAGTMHGALQTGALSSTFTASQGLLLMIPNMYKIAGQLLPNVIHIATRSVATHALSVFGDHSDIMAARQTGYAFLGSASVQEAQDFALIAQAATQKSRIPFVHFMDGFRTSHETNSIELISDEIIREMMDSKVIQEHKDRALSPDNPDLRGTAQGPDVFFQSREAQNVFYKICPAIVQNEMDKFAVLTGRQYKVFDYVGHPEAEQLIIAMASSTETIEETIHYLNQQGNKYGLIKVRLFRPFSKKYLLQALPKSTKSIAVLDRTKEPGSSGEPLYLDIVQAVTEAYQNEEISSLPKIMGGRYGLSSKEFTPDMAHAIFNDLKSNSLKNNFTIGIIDDVTQLSLQVNKEIHLHNDTYQAVFYQEKTANNNRSFNSILKIEGRNRYIQGYTACDYKKSNARNVAHLRIHSRPINAPYEIAQANFVSCQHIRFITNDNAIELLKLNGTLLINSQMNSTELWKSLSADKQKAIKEKNIQVYIVNEDLLKEKYSIDGYEINGIYAAFLCLKSDPLDVNEITHVNNNIHKLDTSVTTNALIENDDFSHTLLGKLLHNKGNELAVSEFPIDGTYPTNTSTHNYTLLTNELPIWNPESCTQCGACSMACPQSAIRMKVYSDSYLDEAPAIFNSITSDDADFDLLNFTVQVNPDQCNGCNNCVDACPVKGALQLTESKKTLLAERDSWNYFERIPELDRNKINTEKIGQQQLQEPLFKYSTGVEACGEAPYLKLLSQLYGDRLLIANATGSSSIFGGALPTTPWSKNKQGKGPAWANSLFEDNAEFGLGFRLALDYQQKRNESVWIVGGDGWAYDIGYGGLDHVLASGKNVNILVLDNEVYDNTGGQMSKATPLGAQAKFAFNGKQKQKKDLGMLAMQYKHVYVASVAMGADQEQTLKAFNEAESFEGTSIIIAYCNSPSHGIDMKNPSNYQKAAVDSGQWLLYRHDPRRIEEGLPPLQLDSETPSVKIEKYLLKEHRFSHLLNADSPRFNTFIRQIQGQVNDRFEKYLTLAASESMQCRIDLP